MDKEKELLESMIDQTMENGEALFTDTIVKQSQVLDKYIVASMRGGERVG